MGSHLSDIVGTRHAPGCGSPEQRWAGESCVRPGIGAGKRGSFGAGVSSWGSLGWEPGGVSWGSTSRDGGLGRSSVDAWLSALSLALATKQTYVTYTNHAI